MSALDHKPRPAKGAPERVIKMRRWSHNPGSLIEVTLVKRHTSVEGYDSGDDVWIDGKFVGTVSKYQGSIDTPIKGTRLRREGKRRTLWGIDPAGSGRWMGRMNSRAEAIRWVL